MESKEEEVRVTDTTEGSDEGKVVWSGWHDSPLCTHTQGSLTLLSASLGLDLGGMGRWGAANPQKNSGGQPSSAVWYSTDSG